ncbi:tRNA pseudouridine synthase 1 [Tulasnella sp. 403]|nr:tRNA pseudouridine synthase 1 [Tulasnella sp. 403]
MAEQTLASSNISAASKRSRGSSPHIPQETISVPAEDTSAHAATGGAEPSASKRLKSNPKEAPPQLEPTVDDPVEDTKPKASGRKGKGAKSGGKNAQEAKRIRNRNNEVGDGKPNPRPRQPVDGENPEEGLKRLAKRKVALLMSFCGTGCSGMQFQHTGARTIEGLLFDALVKAGAISKDNSDHPAKVDLQRAARTDAGVHAAGNMVSLKMIVEPPIPADFRAQAHFEAEPSTDKSSSSSAPPPNEHPTPDEVVAYINSFLPPEIRIWSFIRTRNTFNARKECDSRRYEYLFPSWMLLPPKPGSNLYKMLEKAHAEAGSPPFPSHPFWTVHDNHPDVVMASSTDDTTDVLGDTDDLKRKRRWRVDEGTIGRLKDILKQFEGTHNFHNYTVGRAFNDKAAQRYMMRVEVRHVSVYDDVEWISVLFHGQSFMLHQRKMMSMAIMACRTGTPSNVISETYSAKRIVVPMAPALGLLLEQPIFGSYNERVRSDNRALAKQKVTPEELASRRRDEIDYSKHEAEIHQFKVAFIYERMRREEAESNVFDRWVCGIDAYQGEDLGYLNPGGEIPDSAVIKRGEKREGVPLWRVERKGSILTVDDEEGKGLGGRELEEMEG